MQDRFGRTIDYIRISLTDRCNLRCEYCMPEEGLTMLRHEDILTYEEILRVVRIFAGLGVKKIKLTGGEPLVRRGVLSFIRELKQNKDIEQVTITVNGTKLAGAAAELTGAGINGINVSLDTLDEQKYRVITRGGRLKDVLAGIDRLQEIGFKNIKINCVPLQGFNDDELPRIAAYFLGRQIPVRFIELMPLGEAFAYKGIAMAEVRERLARELGELRPIDRALGNGPADYYEVLRAPAEGGKSSTEGSAAPGEGSTSPAEEGTSPTKESTSPDVLGTVGFIDAIDHKFCSQCNRIRLTAEGFLKLCLQYDCGLDVRALLRSGADDEEIAAAIRNTIYMKKPEEHHFVMDKQDAPPEADKRRMSQVGG